jgi:hypothetical protein
MGYRFKMKYASTDEVTAEIRRVVPIYRNLVMDCEDGSSIWDASATGLPRFDLDGLALAAPVQPVPTLDLDVLEARFQRAFETRMSAARAALEQHATAVP